MGSVVKKISGAITGGGDTQVNSNASDPKLRNTTGLNMNLGDVIAQNTGGTYADYIAAQTNPNVPTIAQAQLKQATDQNIASQMAMANSARGGNAGTTQRLAMQNAAMAGQQGAQQNAILSAQEQQQSAQNALNFRGQNNAFTEAMYGLGSGRDTALMGGQIQGGLGAAQIAQKDKERKAKGFSDFMGNISKGATMGMGGMGG